MEKQVLLKNFTTNLEKERISQNYSQAAWAEMLGFSLSSYKRFINGESSKIDLSTMLNINELTGKSLYELIAEDNYLTKIYKELKTLSTRQLNFIDTKIDFEKNFAASVNDDDSDDYITFFTPTGDMHDGMIYDSTNFENINIKGYRQHVNTNIHYGVKITSNHLHPVYNLGDIILVSKSPIRDGDIGLFLNKETQRVYIRKFHQSIPTRLEPINDFGETFFVDPNNKEDMDKWVKLGKVITKIRL